MDYPKSVPSVGLVNGKFVDENPVNGTPGSLIPAVWGNTVTEELLNVVQAGGLQPSETAHDQLLTAIRTIIKSSLPPEQVRTTLAAYGITDAYTKAEVEALVKSAAALPVGAMMAFPKGTVPPGYLEADGSVQSIATYPDLSAYLASAFNKGDEGAGNFRLPDSRGEFMRGWDHGRGIDTGRAIGSWQVGTFVGGDGDGLNLPIANLNNADHMRVLGIEYDKAPWVPESIAVNFTANSATSAITMDGVQTPGTASGGVDFGRSRPRNLAVMWCIKAWNAPTNQANIDIAALAVEVQNAQKVAVVGSHKGLKVSASGVSSLVSVLADQLVVGNEVSFKTLSALSLSINALVMGINGLDTGLLATSTWYSIWVIWNGTTAAGLLSLSATAPTMPSGYTHKARVGWVRTDGTANKYPLSFSQYGKKVQYTVSASSNVPNLPIMCSGVQGSILAPTWAAISIAGYVPPTSGLIEFVAATDTGGGAIAVTPNSSYGNISSLTNPPPIVASSNNGNPWKSKAGLILEGGNIYVAASAGTALACIGWEDNL